MRRFISFLRKEFLHILRDRVTLLILLVMPQLLVCLFGFVITTETRNSRVVIVDQQHDQSSRAIIQKISESAYFVVRDILAQADALEDLLKRGDADCALIIRKDLGIQILADASEPNQAQTRVMYLQQILGSADSDQALHSQGQIRVIPRLLYNPRLRSEYNFVPGVMGMIILLICALMTSVSIVREKENGTMEVLLASPMRPLAIILAKLVPYLLVALVNLLTILLLSFYVLDVPVNGSLADFFLVSSLYILVSLSLGLLISTAVDTQLGAMLLSLLLMVPAMYLSGLAFPLESMPRALQTISLVVPTRWFNEAARMVLIQGVELRFVLRHVLILALEAMGLILISFSLFKNRLQ